MDFQSFLSKNLNTSQSQEKSIDDLLPDIQKTSSSYNKKAKEKPIIQAQRFSQKQENNEWILKYSLSSPVSDIDYDDLKYFASEFIKLRSYYGEEKYYKLKKINKKSMDIQFDCLKWIRESFSSSQPRFLEPHSLQFSGKKALPTLVYVGSSSMIDFGLFLGNKYKSFVAKKSRILNHKKFGFLKKISADLFNYKYNFRENKFIVSLKPSVILTGLASYVLWKNKKEIGTKRANQLKNKLKRINNIDNLDKFLKKEFKK